MKEGPVELVLLAEPRGFCAGVEMAIKALQWMVEAFEPPVYCYHEIVHNRLVVERFRDLGVVFVDEIDDVPDGVPLMLSAHGSAPEVVAAARERDRVVVNVVCPLVTKVQREAKVRATKGYTVLYVGHEGHDEATGTLAVAPDAMRLVEHVDDLERVAATVPDPSKVASLAQTTLSLPDWQGVMTDARGTVPCAVDGVARRPLLRHHQPTAGTARDRGSGRRHRGDRQCQLVEHDRAAPRSRSTRGAHTCCASTDPTRSTLPRSVVPPSSG